MSQADIPEGIDWRQVLTVALDLACLAYLVWTLCPGLRIELQALVRNAREEKRRQAEWDRITHQLAYETFEVRSAMEGETDELASRLDLAG